MTPSGSTPEGDQFCSRCALGPSLAAALGGWPAGLGLAGVRGLSGLGEIRQDFAAESFRGPGAIAGWRG